jgi:hypothetical protein
MVVSAEVPARTRMLPDDPAAAFVDGRSRAKGSFQLRIERA